MPLSGLDGRWWPWRRKKKEAYQEVVKQENREKEAMKLLEKEQMQKTAMELLEQYLQFQQEVEKEGKKEREGCFEAKHPMSAFFLFSKERREALLQEKETILEISKIAGEEWKNMAEEQKAPYEEEQNGIFSCASSI
ncbi:high mobility group B protein 6-like isoform X1 [Zingiber officinale]|uniref:HMG box domain-containing protein n=1 Tax=Zingiber officinale TaxID=94328 RepID=A0A8J5L1W6_ZINOF|nr:high mobility group B protein 6-like isoform X1 [Zingiber officinale]XP_042399399.1 high mobility group B protein 6-like isoform X1 [Zingiber officinale]XP_042399400.1 high mobility group B protein 6-like isoform X1 [Zingiber officinale]XP_042399401.1 high mobility group B protein 6-like isoform X1 [Zingiber officinale]XP_042402745.1 high mobility group B protein 6-like isoform X1 [Zingiber officinale]XP_042402746.1 high mobility group B protein 6-like isoform X1 [Zingiber officinale]XP_04